MNPFTPEQQQRIIDAIRQAELATSGEIRVHIEQQCPETDPIKRAIQVFADLQMHETQEQNGVLIYLAPGARKFAIIGDVGINTRVPAGFWDSTKDHMRQHFAVGDYTEGLCQGIREAGQQLKQFFPRSSSDTNELSNDISFS